MMTYIYLEAQKYDLQKYIHIKHIRGVGKFSFSYNSTTTRSIDLTYLYLTNNILWCRLYSRVLNFVALLFLVASWAFQFRDFDIWI